MNEFLLGTNMVRLFERFWSKVDVRGPDECWEWKAGRFAKGYGQYRWPKDCGLQKHRKVTAHRAGWELWNQQCIPDGKVACHRCDNPPCCNPRHIFIGSVAENNLDMIQKGRARFTGSPPGERAGSSKLTDEAVRFIRSNPDIRRSELANRYGVTLGTITCVRRRRSWKHIT